MHSRDERRGNPSEDLLNNSLSLSLPLSLSLSLPLSLQRNKVHFFGMSSIFTFTFRYFYGLVTISNEQNFIFGEYCGQGTGQTVVVSGEYAITTFHFSGHGRGFILRFSAIPTGM